MLHEDLHISDEDLILAADGELPRRRIAEIDTHLASCWTCRGRSRDMKAAIANFTRAYHESLHPQLPSSRASRAVLMATLRELAAELLPYRPSVAESSGLRKGSTLEMISLEKV